MTLRGRHRADSTRLGRRFTVLWIGQAVSFLGDKMAYVSIPLFVTFLVTGGRSDAAGGSRELGISYALESAPALLLGFLAGVIIDRLRIRTVLVVADVARAAAFVYLAVVAAGPPTSGIAPVYVVAFLVGSFTTLFTGGLYALVPSLVPARDLALANARLTAVETVGSAIGPALAGGLLSLAGGPGGPAYSVVFVADALTFAVSAVAVVMVGSVPRAAVEGPPKSIGADIMNGLRYLWNELRLRISTLALAVGNFVVGFIEATLVLIAVHEDLVAAGETWQTGVVFAMFGVGGFAGALLAPRVVRWLGLGRSMVIGTIGFGLMFRLFVGTRFGLTGLAYLFVALIALQLINVPVATIRQAYTPPVLLGRVITASRAIGWATLPLGALVGTTLVENGVVEFATLVRLSPLLILGIGLVLIPTVLWTDTFGPMPGRRVEPRPARRRIRI